MQNALSLLCQAGAAAPQHTLVVGSSALALAVSAGSCPWDGFVLQELLLLPELLQERQTLTPAVPTWARTGLPPPGLQLCPHHIYLEVLWREGCSCWSIPDVSKMQPQAYL